MKLSKYQKKLTTKLIPLLAILSLTSCAKNTAGTEPKPNPVNEWCAFAQVIYVSKNDVLTEGTAKQIYYHNEMVSKLCLTGDKKSANN